jgi:hypothetical protein
MMLTADTTATLSSGRSTPCNNRLRGAEGAVAVVAAKAMVGARATARGKVRDNLLRRRGRVNHRGSLHRGGKGNLRGSLRHRGKGNLRGSLRRRGKGNPRGSPHRGVKANPRGSLRRRVKVNLRDSLRRRDKPNLRDKHNPKIRRTPRRALKTKPRLGR